MALRRYRAVAALAGILIVTSSCQAAAHHGAKGRPAQAAPVATRARQSAHVVVIVMENKEYGSVIGSRHAPYLDKLARHHVLLTRYDAVTHPSLPNYLALTGGSTFGIHSDCTTCSVKGRNLVDQLEAHHLSWRAYMQGMPRACFRGAIAGRFPQQYAKKHDPFLYFDDVRNDRSRCNHVVPFTRFRKRLRTGLPSFAWITPNLCNDMHSCSVATGDRFLRTWVPRILPALKPNGIVLVVFDEGVTDANCCGLMSGGGHVAAVIAGPGAKKAVKLRGSADHYSMLRLIEDAFGLSRLRNAAARATPTIRGWRG